MTNKRRKSPTPDWCNIHSDVFDLVLSRLSFVDKFLVQRVCSSWRSFAKTHISNLAHFPLLMLPTNRKYEYIGFNSSYDASDYKIHCDSEDSGDRCLFKIEDKKFKKVKSIPKDIRLFSCVGSSQGWLVFLDEEERRYHIFNPFFDICIRLSSLRKLPGMTKAILWSCPIKSRTKYALVALHGFEYNIAYAMCGNSSWKSIKGENSPYFDIVCFKDFVYALGKTCLIEAWDLSTNEPTKKISINPPLLQETSNEFKVVPKNFYSLKRYLVRSQDQCLMVVRYIEAFEKIYENGVTEYIPFPYGTKKFHVYQLNEKEEKWVKTDSLGDMLLILGNNHSVSVAAKNFKGYKKNSIYFSDDNYKPIPGCYYAGHDMGQFNLRDGFIEPFIVDELWQLIPDPFWVVPHF